MTTEQYNQNRQQRRNHFFSTLSIGDRIQYSSPETLNAQGEVQEGVGGFLSFVATYSARINNREDSSIIIRRRNGSTMEVDSADCVVI